MYKSKYSYISITAIIVCYSKYLYESLYIKVSLSHLTTQHGLLYTLPMNINRSMKLHSIYSILHILL